MTTPQPPAMTDTEREAEQQRRLDEGLDYFAKQGEADGRALQPNGGDSNVIA